MNDPINRAPDPHETAETYEPPRVIEDAPLECISLACTKADELCIERGIPPISTS